jgi:hypothetical protein
MTDKEAGTRREAHPSNAMTTDANTTRLLRLAALAALAVLGAAGCRQNGDAPRDDAGVTHHGEKFPADGEVRPIDRFIRAQSAAAARTDSALFAHHFDAAGDLNSLGRRKLDLMLEDDAAPPLVVYLDLARPGADPAPADRCGDAVRAYLADRGLGGLQLEVRTGHNPADTHPARDGLRGLRALQNEQAGAPAEDGGPARNRSASGMEAFARPQR